MHVFFDRACGCVCGGFRCCPPSIKLWRGKSGVDYSHCPYALHLSSEKATGYSHKHECLAGGGSCGD